jgi:hypothetical protein
VETLNRTRADGGKLALHEGEVMYGNIGAAGRLGGLSKTLGR